ncbi:MAG: hypothetical protein AB1921_00310 [Thermodesulfobacteriota bacterium]
MPFDIQPTDILAKVTRYELMRETDRVSIDLYEIIAGRADAGFVAIPSDATRAWGDQQFWGTGPTAEDALATCLTRIKGVSADVFLPRAAD